MNVAARRSQPPVAVGWLFTRMGEVHEEFPDSHPALTVCGRDIPRVRVEVSALQAQVHKLALCSGCYPPVNHTRGGDAQ